MTLQLRVYVPPHPLIQHGLAIVRNTATPVALFRTAAIELGRWLTYEATRDWLPTQEGIIQTPLENCPATMLDTEVPVALIPILRAGLTLSEGAGSVLSLASVYHLGIVRNEETLEPSFYLNKLPEQFDPQTRVLIADPMLATGGTMMAAMAEIVKRGADPANIRIISIVAAPPALQKLSEAYPSLNIYTAAIDEHLNDRGYIVPGLGDAGDRAFGT
ncbi:MAG: uracil phosphoribosyltransferase [Oscillatoria sp. SIO1A7]|nr:uracil phosphoribosyltransferase [Oscillatoria sp. SIO1A7]